MQPESQQPQPGVEPQLLPSPPSYPLLAAPVVPPLLPAPPSYPLLGPPRVFAPAPEIPLSELVAVLTERLMHGDAVNPGGQVRACIADLNRRLTSRDGKRTYFAYPTESLERLEVQLAAQARSAGNQEEGQAWRTLSKAFASAIQQRERMG